MSAPSFRAACVGSLLALLAPVSQATWVDGAQVGAATQTAALSLAVSAADGSLLKAEGGLFRSTDGGKHWWPLPLPETLHPDRLRQVATTVTAPASLYAAGLGAGVVRSEDNGRTWRSIIAGLPGQDVAAFAVHSFRPDTIYVWIPRRGIFRTENSGRQWQKMDDGPPASVLALAHSPLKGSMNTGWLYAATPSGPYLSMDCF
jgi:photosystem II stability/assembly factor-like uncharacterized protein